MLRVFTSSGLLLSLAVLAGFSSLAVRAQDAQEWLARTQRAVRETNYSGTLVYNDGRTSETLRVFHAYRDGQQRERLVALTGAPREVIRNGGRVVSIAGAPARVYDLLPAGFPDQWGNDAESASSYELSLGPADRVADRAAQVLEIRARDAFRYSLRLWLDRETALPLKRVRYGADGISVEEMMFVDLRAGEAPDESDLVAAQSSESVVAMPEIGPSSGGLSARSPVKLCRERDLPPDFVPVLASPSTRVRAQGSHRVFSDGIAYVSVYIEPASAEDAPISVGRGAVHVFTRISGGQRIYVIGDVPLLTVQRFAHAVDPAGCRGGD